MGNLSIKSRKFGKYQLRIRPVWSDQFHLSQFIGQNTVHFTLCTAFDLFVCSFHWISRFICLIPQPMQFSEQVNVFCKIPNGGDGDGKWGARQSSWGGDDIYLNTLIFRMRYIQNQILLLSFIWFQLFTCTQSKHMHTLYARGWERKSVWEWERERHTQKKSFVKMVKMWQGRSYVNKYSVQWATATTKRRRQRWRKREESAKIWKEPNKSEMNNSNNNQTKTKRCWFSFVIHVSSVM